MNPKVGSWWAVAASAELGKRPLGLTRFNEKLVFWRNGTDVVCMRDRCPHRGAALSLGRINKKDCTLACPFHGLEFGADGRCTHVPVESDYNIPPDFGVQTYPVREADGYIFLWRGPVPDELPELPVHHDTIGMGHGDSSGIWHAHYTRCIENVCDFSHLPFVHRTTIGLFKKDWVTSIRMQDVVGGFRAHLLENGKQLQSFEFLYPNRWLLRLSPNFMQGLVFAPIDDQNTFVYGRTWYRPAIPGMKWLMDPYTRFSQFMVFREDWPIVASQDPGDVLEATDEKLLPSDAPVMAYRKLHRSHY